MTAKNSAQPTNFARPKNSAQPVGHPPVKPPIHTLRAQVVSLDRGYPLVRSEGGEQRAQHATQLIKQDNTRAAVGDFVLISQEPTQEIATIDAILPRRSVLVRRQAPPGGAETSGKPLEQILATNFDFVMIVQSLGHRPLDVDYLERQLVMGLQSGEPVFVLLTKADLARHPVADRAAARAAARNCEVFVYTTGDVATNRHFDLKLANVNSSIELAALFLPNKTGVLLGRSGVGKSSFVNRLILTEQLSTASVRAKDRAGRHTTVARKLVDLPQGGQVIDTPGLRSVGIYGDTLGLALAFSDITAVAAECKYRNCSHRHEPDCAVAAAVASGAIPARRLHSYRALAREVEGI
ncbi:MAG: ribosome small subunit-dependent GTPase A [Coriobacteriales bacterium]|jgi:ribosome biogenesis GTPase|nr:ribosome small subunit-dependent GTPase A [Coriobacteriales bacterium]